MLSFLRTPKNQFAFFFVEGVPSSKCGHVQQGRQKQVHSVTGCIFVFEESGWRTSPHSLSCHHRTSTIDAFWIVHTYDDASRSACVCVCLHLLESAWVCKRLPTCQAKLHDLQLRIPHQHSGVPSSCRVNVGSTECPMSPSQPRLSCFVSGVCHVFL